MEISSESFDDQKPIPKKYTGEGEDISPPLDFKDIPDEAISLVLIVDDPDAPDGTFDHWIVWNLPAQMKQLPENAQVPVQGKNHFGENFYNGPKPPPGPLHHYFFKLYALDTNLNLAEGSSKEEVEAAMKGHILEQCELVGTYKR